MEIICYFVTIIGLTNDERCLIHSLRVEKHCGGSERIMKVFYINENILIVNN